MRQHLNYNIHIHFFKNDINIDYGFFTQQVQ